MIEFSRDNSISFSNVSSPRNMHYIVSPRHLNFEETQIQKHLEQYSAPTYQPAHHQDFQIRPVPTPISANLLD